MYFSEAAQWELFQERLADPIDPCFIRALEVFAITWGAFLADRAGLERCLQGGYFCTT
jgi:hypothetical protein